jgi:hypothetical protein
MAAGSMLMESGAHISARVGTGNARSLDSCEQERLALARDDSRLDLRAAFVGRLLKKVTIQ